MLTAHECTFVEGPVRRGGVLTTRLLGSQRFPRGAKIVRFQVTLGRRVCGVPSLRIHQFVGRRDPIKYVNLLGTRASGRVPSVALFPSVLIARIHANVSNELLNGGQVAHVFLPFCRHDVF